MALKQKEIMAWGILGFIATLVTSYILKFISQIVSMIPGVDVNLQSISITGTGLGGVIGTGLSEYAQKALGLIPISLTIPEAIIAGIGGALFVIVGAFVADMAGQLKGSKLKRLTTVLVVAGVVSAWLISMAIEIPAISMIVIMIVDAVILSYILITADDMLGTKLVP